MKASRSSIILKIGLLALFLAYQTNAVHFDCAFDFYTPAPIGIVYTCRPTVILSGSSTLKSVTGIHRPGYTNDNVEFLFVGSENLPFVPRELSKFFKNLRAIEYMDTRVLSISAQDLQIPTLEYLFLNGNSFTSLDGDLFSFTPRMKFIHLGHNQIQHIGPDLLTNLSHLQRLYLNGNICIDKSAETREEVEELVTQLSILCPPPIEPCSCEYEIAQLRKEIQQQNQKLEQLQYLNDELIRANKKLTWTSQLWLKWFNHWFINGFSWFYFEKFK